MRPPSTAPVAALHLVEPRRLGPLGAHIIPPAVGPHDAVVVLGGAPARDDCRDAGLGIDARIAPPTGRAVLAWRPLRRAVRALRPATIIAWSAGSLAAARLASPEVRACAALCEPPRPGWPLCAIERAAVRRHASARWAIDSDTRDAWSAAAGVCDIPILEPAIDSGRLAGRWAAARDRWSADGAIVVGFASDGRSVLDGYAAAKVAGALGLSGVRAVAVIPSDAALLERAARLRERLDRLWEVRLERGPEVEWLPACDVVVEERPGSLAGRIAARAGATVVPAEPRRHGAVSAGNTEAHAGAARIIELRDRSNGAPPRHRAAPWSDGQVRAWAEGVRAACGGATA